MFYPLHLLNAEQEGSKELLEKSVEHWHSLPDNILGFSYTGASLLYAAFGEGNKALEKLNGLFALTLRPNTMYMESGPVIETPLSGAQCVHEMLLQSWGKKYAYSPPSPPNGRTSGSKTCGQKALSSFPPSAKEGKQQTYGLKASRENLHLTDGYGKSCCQNRQCMLVPQGKGVYALDIRKGETVTITSQACRSIPDRPG